MIKSKAISFITAAVMVCFSFFSFLPRAYAEGEIAEDTTPPEVFSTSPSNGDTGVSESTAISIVFTEDIQAGEDSVYNSISVMKGSSAVTINKSITGGTLTLTPGSMLYEGTYTVTVSAGSVADLTGNALASEYTFSFTAEGAPRIMYTDPADGAKSVPSNKVFSVYFDQEIVIANQSLISVTPSDTDRGYSRLLYAVTGASNTVFTITPDGSSYKWDLGWGSTYTVLIKAGAISDAHGNVIDEDLTFKFTTVDTHAPWPWYFTPENYADDVPLDEPLIITFYRDIYPDVNFNNIQAGGVPVNVTIFDGNKVRILPVSGQWPNHRNIYWTLPAKSVKNYDNVSIDFPYERHFTTVDVIGPVLSYSFPVGGATAFSVTEQAAFTFDESVYAGPQYSNITASCEGEPVSLRKTISFDKLLLMDRTQWKWEKTYIIHIPAGALQDNVGNTNAVGYDLTFTTATKPALTIEDPRHSVMVINMPYRFFYNVDVACNIKLEILRYDYSAVLRTYNVNNVSPGMHSIYWDAKNSSGHYFDYAGVPVKITAFPLDGSPALVATAVYERLHKAGIAVEQFPSTWYPKKNPFYTVFTLSTTGNMSISFYKSNKLVFQVTGVSDTPDPTIYAWEWDGKFSDGTYIPAGYYMVVFRFANEGSKDSVRKYVTIKY